MITLNELSFHLYDKEANKDIRQFLWSFIIDTWLFKNKNKLFYNNDDRITESVFRVLDEKKFEKFKHEEWWDIEFEFWNWIITEFFWKNKFKIELPLNTDEWSKDITSNFITYYLWPLARHKNINDLYFNIVKHFINWLWIYYNFSTRKIWFWNKPRKKYLFSLWKKLQYSAKQYTLEEVLAAEIAQWFVNKEVWDVHRDYWYTHLLRQAAKFDLTNWWKRVLINWKKYNILATTRWQGKTYLAWLIAARWLLDSRPWFWWRQYREIKYFVPDKENIGTQVMEYIKSFIWDMATIKLPNWKKAFEFKWSTYVKCNITWNVLKIISLYRFWQWWELWSALWEWLACDLAIIDEAARIPNDFWYSFHQRAAFETQEFYLSSTINMETTVDHWFYDLLVRWESWEENISSYRITLEENEIMRKWKTDKEWMTQMEMVKNDLRKKWEREFYCRVYCIILEESNVFNLAWTIVNWNTKKYNQDDWRILWFDLAKLDDTAWLVLINLNSMEIEEAIKVTNLTYWAQLEYAEEYKEKYQNIFVIWDRSWVWEAVSEQDEKWVVDCWIKSTWQWDVNYNKRYWYYTASKWFIVNNCATLLNNNIIKIPWYNTDLIEQLNNFIKMKSWRWEAILYKWKWKSKDDLVLSLAYACFYLTNVLWLKSREDIEDYIKQTWNNTMYSYNLYDNDYSQQSNYYNWIY